MYPSQLTLLFVLLSRGFIEKRDNLAKAKNDSSTPLSGQRAYNLCIHLFIQHHKICKSTLCCIDQCPA